MPQPLKKRIKIFHLKIITHIVHIYAITFTVLLFSVTEEIGTLLDVRSAALKRSALAHLMMTMIDERELL